MCVYVVKTTAVKLIDILMKLVWPKVFQNDMTNCRPICNEAWDSIDQSIHQVVNVGKESNNHFDPL